jgi:hypothetical protein
MGSQHERSIRALFGIIFGQSVEPLSIDAAVEWGHRHPYITDEIQPGKRRIGWFGPALLIWEEAALYIVEHR